MQRMTSVAPDLARGEERVVRDQRLFLSDSLIKSHKIQPPHPETMV